MNTNTSTQAPLHVIRIGQHFDDHVQHQLETAVFKVQEAHGKHILLDLGAVSRIDSRGLGKLFLAYHHLNRNHIRLGILNPCPAVKEMLDFVNLTQIVTIFGSLDEAIELEHHGVDELGFQPVEFLEG